jgi:hypothetical protein
MTALVHLFIRLGLLKEGLDYYLIRAPMALVFLFFGYQK